jgi:WD40 repeat protein
MFPIKSGSGPSRAKSSSSSPDTPYRRGSTTSASRAARTGGGRQRPRSIPLNTSSWCSHPKRWLQGMSNGSGATPGRQVSRSSSERGERARRLTATALDAARPPLRRSRLGRLAGRIARTAAWTDGRIVTGGVDGVVRIWDAQSGAEICHSERMDGVINAIAALPSGRIVSAPGDGKLRIWDPQSGAEVCRVEGHGWNSRWLCVAALPVGRVVSGGDGRVLRIWDAESGAELRQLDHMGENARCVVALPDGRIVSGGPRVLWVWDGGSDQPTASLHIDDPPSGLIVLASGDVIVLDMAGRRHLFGFARNDARARS